MIQAGDVKLPPLWEPSMDPTQVCGLCFDSGWERCWELHTYRQRLPKRVERITKAQYDAWLHVVEGPGIRVVVEVARRCRCDYGRRLAAAAATEPERKPARRERADLKAKASGE